ncbi:rhodanese-like domain-containing protein [Serratia sp. UGAL515B_01]|uniref:rhodanese-like domain-containing protein n=1 Tax=Serratia sp. UGAL515B_01 TaxID=2986763 RepID=UPI002953F154|nr:rhodanese-like domain-containing protein [Serratia sp. UGAL515B_01]WON75701.1 rhodanese-like domain-containing protein [Serratia sp. UGAL515B_01]
MTATSLVLVFPPVTAQQSMDYLREKLSYYADSADVAEDLRNGISEIVVIDTRVAARYAAGHIPGAVSFPHGLMDENSTQMLDRGKVYITYCDGIGCNGSTKGAYALAKLGFQVKELIGGLDFWLRDGLPLAIGDEKGTMQGQAKTPECGC